MLLLIIHVLVLLLVVLGLLLLVSVMAALVSAILLILHHSINYKIRQGIQLNLKNKVMFILYSISHFEINPQKNEVKVAILNLNIQAYF